jgi:2,3-bisphosphoglycerate-independent phosphoglycerate mutase
MCAPNKKSPQANQHSSVVEKANVRAAGLVSIDSKLDLGGGFTATAYQGKIDDAQEKLNEYNTLLSNVDEALSELEKAEATLADWSERMLKGVASRFGRDSDEYEKAGGTKKSDIQRSPRKSSADNVKKLAA